MELESVFPLPLDDLWKLLHAHLDDDRLRSIHPWMVSGQTTGEKGIAEFNGLSFPREKTAERVAKLGTRPSHTAWRYIIEPPRRYSYEIAFDNGSTARFENVYAPAQGGTLVKTAAELSIKRVPAFLAKRVVNRSLNRGEAEDIAYARKMGL
jgi:hypothetical protein